MKCRNIFLFILFVFILISGVSSGTPISIIQGRTLVLTLNFGNAKDVYGKIFEREIKFYPYKGEFRGIIGVPIETKTGRYLLTVEADGVRKIEKEIVVKRGKFSRRWFSLKPEKRKLLTRKIIEKDWKKIEKVLIKEDSSQLWKGRFRIPARGLISLPFGAIQIINGARGGYHKGIDIAGKNNYKIRATNYGQVVLAERLVAHGNTIVINHGQGIHSMYLHLSKNLVKPGDIVWKGKPIGYMGSTGVATGTHLHFGLSVHNVRVDPLEWVYQRIIE